MDDLISRQSAIDGFYEMASDIDHLCTVGDYVKYLENMPSAQPELRWIPVTERMPENDHYVLISYGDRVDIGAYDCEYEWHDDEFVPLYDVNAWMELPDSYRKEGKNE